MKRKHDSEENMATWIHNPDLKIRVMTNPTSRSTLGLDSRTLV